MKIKHCFQFLLFLFGFAVSGQSGTQQSDVVDFEVNPSEYDVNFFLKNKSNVNYGSLGDLKQQLATDQKELLFAMNGGMYLKDKSPQGLYIEQGILKTPLDTLSKGYGNFYLHPNGVFYITKDNKGVVLQNKEFEVTKNINFATQSGPMLLIDGNIHPAFREGSSNVHFRNAVGVLPNGNLLFAISTKKINFYDLACYFKDRGCKNALYLDGFVSRAYIPSKNWQQVDGDFGVIIGIFANN